MRLTGKHIVGNEFVGSGPHFYARNPALDAPLQPGFHEATDKEVHIAVEKAHLAFDSYRMVAGKAKADFLDAIVYQILTLGEDLITRCNLETGLPVARLLGERARTVSQLQLFADLLREGSWVQARIDRADPSRSPLPKPDVRSMLRPLGPVGIFGASNFPFAFSVAGGDTVSALAAGCTVVVKAHPAHPGTSEMIGTAIQKATVKANMPEGTFNLVQGSSKETGMAIVNHPRIKAIGFTGSFQGGKAIFDAANLRPQPIPVFAEMGSSNPVFILPDALKAHAEAIAKGLVASVSLGVGQFCTNPGLVVLENNDDARTFKEYLVKFAHDIAPGTMLSSGIRSNFMEGVSRLANTIGVAVLRMQENNLLPVETHLFQTDVNSLESDPVLEKEIFGPSTLLVLANNRDQLLAASRLLEGHLTATIHATQKDLTDYVELISVLETKVGRIILNGYPTGVEVCHAMIHGGPYPATTAPATTSVGTLAINRFARPVSFQNFAEAILPDELKDSNPLKIWQMIDGNWRKNSIN